MHLSHKQIIDVVTFQAIAGYVLTTKDNYKNKQTKSDNFIQVITGLKEYKVSKENIVQLKGKRGQLELGRECKSEKMGFGVGW